MVDLFEADDLLFVQYLDRVEPQVPSALSYIQERQSLDRPSAISKRGITKMDATKTTRAECTMDNEVLNGIGGFGSFLECR